MNQKHQIISCECKSKFDRIKKIQINGGIMINVDISVKILNM